MVGGAPDGSAGVNGAPLPIVAMGIPGKTAVWPDACIAAIYCNDKFPQHISLSG